MYLRLVTGKLTTDLFKMLELQILFKGVLYVNFVHSTLS